MAKGKRGRKAWEKRKVVGRPASKKPRSIPRSPSYFFTRSKSQTILLDNVLFNSNLIRLDNSSAISLDAVTLGSLPDFTDFQHLFGGYKIRAVQYKITPQLTGSDDGQVVSPQVKFISVYDPFDNLSSTITGTAMTELNQFQNKREKNLIQSDASKGISAYFKTSQRVPADTTGVLDAYTTIKPRWASTDQHTIQHFGPALYLQTVDGSLFSNGNLAIKVETKYYLEFKTVR